MARNIATARRVPSGVPACICLTYEGRVAFFEKCRKVASACAAGCADKGHYMRASCWHALPKPGSGDRGQAAVLIQIRPTVGVGQHLQAGQVPPKTACRVCRDRNLQDMEAFISSEQRFRMGYKGHPW